MIISIVLHCIAIHRRGVLCDAWHVIQADNEAG